ncbi:MAG: hypothetical protein AB7Q76_22450 [Gammaproteobacteria bacterium]
MNHRRRAAPSARWQIAQLAARLLVEGAARGFGAAKRKAATMISAAARDMPDNALLLVALIEYQRLFERDTLPLRNAQLRRAARDAMDVFRDFSPRLHGAVLFGTTLRDTAVGLHVFTDEVESLTRFLVTRHIPFRLRDAERTGSRPGHERSVVFELARDGVEFELMVMPIARLRQPAASPLNGAPFRYADRDQLEQLLTRDPGGLNLAGLELPYPPGP